VWEGGTVIFWVYSPSRRQGKNIRGSPFVYDDFLSNKITHLLSCVYCEYIAISPSTIMYIRSKGHKKI
jgi:hypothetical protein